MATQFDTSKGRKRAFLAALSKGWSVSRAAQEAGVDRTTVYKWRERSAAFGRDWDFAFEAGTDLLEDIAHKRAFEGSDTLLIFMLKARRPHKFRDNATVEITGKDGGPLVVRYPVKAEDPEKWENAFSVPADPAVPK